MPVSVQESFMVTSLIYLSIQMNLNKLLKLLKHYLQCMRHVWADISY